MIGGRTGGSDRRGAFRITGLDNSEPTVQRADWFPRLAMPWGERNIDSDLPGHVRTGQGRFDTGSDQDTAQSGDGEGGSTPPWWWLPGWLNPYRSNGGGNQSPDNSGDQDGGQPLSENDFVQAGLLFGMAVVAVVAIRRFT